MSLTYQNPVYEYVRSPDQGATQAVHHPVIVVGAGPIGMGVALDLGLHGVGTLVLDDNNTVSVGSRAICFSKRALEVLDRLGCGERMVDKGVTWNVGKVFFRDKLVTRFDLLPEPGHKMPAFINLQQYYLEEYMVERMNEFDNIELRWKNKVIAIDDSAEQTRLSVETPDGVYDMTCDWLVVADGANSDLRAMLGLESTGKVFEDRFLIADIVMKANFPPERWFNFDPSYHRGQSTLLHRQAENVWRLDFQLGWDKDPDQEKKPENIIPRVRAMLGDDVDFELEWASVYTFQCRRMRRFRKGSVLFTGDAAHQVSPFGARGANSGLQDTDNLAWKLKLVMDGKAPSRLLDSYCEERELAADENIMNSTRSTDFITPKSNSSRQFRDATLELSKRFDFARKLTNSGRLSDTTVLTDSSLNSPDDGKFDSLLVAGAVMADSPVKGGSADWLLNAFGNRFQVMLYVDDIGAFDHATLDALQAMQDDAIPVETVVVYRSGEAPADIHALCDVKGMVAERYDARNGSAWLIRPDQHIAARMRAASVDRIRQAVARASAQH
ncbi:MAG: FAD-dependent oxidoreductase [Gammaproteobacteria bacterium]|nr:FAD-dependent oxidoreductase [Gammaproteobacteria bacterium]